MHSRIRCLFVAMLCIVMCTAAFAQSDSATSGSINGRITDSTGAGLPGVTVTATNLDTGLTRNRVTENTGDYTFTLLPPGRYRVDAELAGLGKAASPTLTVLLGNSTRADVKLAPQVSETITVTAGAPVIDTQRSGLAASVTNQQIENLPLLGRDFRSLAALTPGVGTASFDGAVTANGARALSTDFNIDGASSNNDFFGQQTGGARPPFTFSQAAIKEFQVIRTQYDAEYGRGVGATVNAITKSGTNDVDGEAFYFLRKKSWASTRPLVINTNINGTTFPLAVSDSFLAKDSSQPGFAVGGPIMRDKLFYFLNADGQKQSQPVTIGNDLRTSTQFLALTAAQQSTVLSKIQAAVGVPYETGLNYSQDNKLTAYLFKLDGSIGSNNHWSFRDNITKFDTTNSGATSAFGLNQTNEVDKFYQAVLEGDSVITNNLYNQFIGQLGRDQRPVTSQYGGTEFSINTGQTPNPFFGANDTTPNTADEKKYQVKDTLSYQTHGHSLKVGGELLHRNLFDSFPRFAGGMYAFSSLLNFVNNTPNTFQQAAGVNNGDVEWNTNLWGAYINDSFHIGPRLNIDAGLRYDYEATPRPPSNAFPAHPEFLSQIKNDSNNIAPRLGFSYDVFGTGRSVLRGGSGKFFSYMPDILLASPIQGISGALRTATFTCNTSATNPCPAYPNIFTTDQFLAKASLGANLVTIGSDYQAQEAWRTSLQFEQQLGQSYSAGISGIYSKLTHVQGTKNINVVPTGVILGNMPVYDYNSSANAARPYKDLGIIREITSNEDAWYRAQTLEFHKLAINNSNLSWDLSYTHAASIDNETNSRSTSTTFLIDPNNPALSEGPSDNDVKHRVVGNLTYRLPFGFRVSAIGFWHSGFPYTGAVSFTCNGCTANSLTGQAQTSVAANFTPVFINGSGQIIDITKANKSTPAEFATFLSGQSGHLISRNTFRQPSVWDGDVRLSKLFNLTHGVQLEVLGEMFNVFNKRIGVVTGVNQDLYRVTYCATAAGATCTAAAGQPSLVGRYVITNFTNNVAPAGQTANQQNTFGVIQGYSNEVSPRQMQFAAKIIF
ncbi:MAG TPA: carboxypeptidase regulatory-like domain-containing protein [Thermoanaerobaculia bacterium]|nr:carboxypeptidase regulatory-like domain-containing protein [Thermoanaerobaculia bacterium]